MQVMRAGQIEDHPVHVARRMIESGQARLPKPDELEGSKPATKAKGK